MNRALAKASQIAARFRAEAATKLPKGKLANQKADRGQLYIYDLIGADFFGEGVTAQSVQTALAELKGVSALDIFINSEGGDVFEAKAIFAQLQRFAGQKTVYVDGIAASAATMVAMAGDRIVTAPQGTWMIHDAWSIAVGSAGDLRAVADRLDLQSADIAQLYAEQTGKPVAAMRQLMTAETWLNAEQALALGLTDEIAQDDDDKASAKASLAISPLIAAANRTHELVTPAAVLTARAQLRSLKVSADQSANGAPARLTPKST